MNNTSNLFHFLKSFKSRTISILVPLGTVFQMKNTSLLHK